MISREQIKAARAMLDWSQGYLADQCESVSVATIKLIEAGKIKSTDKTLGIIQKTLEKNGLEFLPQSGVRLKDDVIEIIERETEHENIYLRLLDDVYYTLKDSGGEVLISYADNSKSPQDVIDKQLMIRNAGIRTRFLVRAGDTHLIYPLDEYRYLPEGHFVNSPSLVYGKKHAVMIKGEGESLYSRIIVINNDAIAEIQKSQFEYFWQMGAKPEATTAL